MDTSRLLKDRFANLRSMLFGASGCSKRLPGRRLVRYVETLETRLALACEVGEIGFVPADYSTVSETMEVSGDEFVAPDGGAGALDAQEGLISALALDVSGNGLVNDNDFRLILQRFNPPQTGLDGSVPPMLMG